MGDFTDEDFFKYFGKWVNAKIINSVEVFSTADEKFLVVFYFEAQGNVKNKRQESCCVLEEYFAETKDAADKLALRIINLITKGKND